MLVFTSGVHLNQEHFNFLWSSWSNQDSISRFCITLGIPPTDVLITGTPAYPASSIAKVILLFTDESKKRSNVLRIRELQVFVQKVLRVQVLNEKSF